MGFNEEFFKYLASLGVGGIIAGLIFAAYRKDVKSYTDLWKTMSDALITVVKENTASNTRLTTVVEALHRRIDERTVGDRRNDDRRLNDADGNT